MTDDGWRDRLTGGGDPYRSERIPEDTAAGRRRAKAEGTYGQYFGYEEQTAPSVHQQTLARARERANPPQREDQAMQLPTKYSIEDVVDEAERRAQRREREHAARPDTINVMGRIYEVDENGELADDRARNQVQAMAEQQANTAVHRGINNYNKQLPPHQRIDLRDATENEIAAAYKQLIDEGRHRAETGNSATHGIDLGDVVRGALG